MNSICQSYVLLCARRSGTSIKYGIGLGMPFASSIPHMIKAYPRLQTW
jgi:hypothetical protein